LRSPLSVVLVAHNAAAQLPECLASAAFADEILLVDSGSADGTAEAAAKLGARVIQKEWLGFGRQKQFAVGAAANDWVLCLDADERVSRELAASIVRALEAPAAPAYRMARSNRFMGRWLKHGEGYPDWSLRLFDRRHARWSDDEVHEKVLCDAEPATLEGDLLHESAEDMRHYLEKQERYAELAARQLLERGERAGLVTLAFSPVFRFVKFYLLRLGFLDGLPGLVHIWIGCRNSFMKYAKLMELRKTAK